MSPYFIYKGIQHQKQQKLEAEKRAQEQAGATTNLRPLNKQNRSLLNVQQFPLNVYSSAAWHSFGENEQILQDIQQFKSPELDDKLIQWHTVYLSSATKSKI